MARVGSRSHRAHLAATAGLLLAVVLAVDGPPAGAAAYQVQPEGSRVLAVTRRAGVLGFLGHDHAIEGAALSGTVTYVPEAAPGERVGGEVIIDAAALEIDSPAALRAAGLGKGPSGDDLAEIRRTFYGPEGLHTGRFPVIRLVLKGVPGQTGAPPGAAPADPAAISRVTGELTIRDRTRPITIPVSVGRSGGRLLVRGRTEVRQTDFGIEPASVAGGLVKVRDRVEVWFVLLLEESAAAR